VREWLPVHVCVNLTAVREVQFYRTPAGQCPVEEFLDSLPGKQAQKIVWVLRLVEELEAVPAQYLKKLGGTEDLWEIRAQQGSDTFRLLGFFEPPGVLVLTHGFAKKSEKLPRREIDVAEARRREHLERRSRQ
jgi:phage-related protein